MKLENIPKIKSCFLPTPIEKLENISKIFTNNIYVKRDDLTGHHFGGNKERKLEYIMADAINKNASVIVTVGSPTSNHNMITTGFANKLGLKTELIVIKKENMENKKISNYNICKMMGARIHEVNVDEVKNKINQLLEKLRKEGEKPYFIEGGGHNVFGTISYIKMVEELKRQTENMGINPDFIVLPVGTATTYAGILLGSNIYNLKLEVIGISIARKKNRCIKEIEKIIEETEKYLKISQTNYEKKIRIYENYIGQGYGIPYKESKSAIELLAKKEGMILDPIYNGKAMNGLLDLTSKKKLKGTIIYLNTGGVANIFSQLGDSK